MAIIRNTMNAGEVSNKARNRTDIDLFHRSCSSILNFEVGQMGGLRRRKGMQKITPALSPESRLLPFVFSRNESALLEFAPNMLRVLVNGVETWRTADTPWKTVEHVRAIRHLQMNDVITFYCAYFFPHNLSRLSGDSTQWLLQPVRFKQPPEQSNPVEGITLDVVGGQYGHNLIASASVFNPEMETDAQIVTATRRVPSQSLSYTVQGWDSVPQFQDLSQAYIGVGFKYLHDNKWYYYTPIRTFTPADYVPGRDEPDEYSNIFQPGIEMAGMATEDFYAGGAWTARSTGESKWKLMRRPDLNELNYWNNWSSYHNVSEISQGDKEIRNYHEDSPSSIKVLILESPNGSSLGSLKIDVDAFEMSLPLVIRKYISPVEVQANYTLDLKTGGTLGQFRPYSNFRADSWRLGAFGSTTGFPIAMAYHQNRLWFAGTVSEPQTVWASRPGDFWHFGADHANPNNSAINVTIASTSQNAIQWIEPLRGLCIGTADGEWVLTGSNGIVSAATAGFEKQSSIGSSFLPAVSIENGLIYIQRDNRRLWQYAYNYQVNGYMSEELTVFAEHILGDGVLEVSYQRTPERTLWCLKKDGTIATLVYNQLQNVKAWSRIETEGRVNSLTVIPDPQGRQDQIWLVVNRDTGAWIETINEDSPWLDHAVRDESGQWTGLPYMSEFLTTPLDLPQTSGTRQHSSIVEADFVATPNTNQLEITNDGIKWVYNGRREQVLEGWYEMNASSTWARRFTAGIRTNSNQPLEVLAIKLNNK